METRKKEKTVKVLKILLPILCGLWLGFIFGQSFLPAEESASSSSAVVDAFQTVVGWFAPQSSLATATGEAYEQLHLAIRKVAHFGEYAVLGVLMAWCYFIYAKGWRFIWLPVVGAFLFPLMDEGLQLLIDGRVGSFTDVAIDWCGAIMGGAIVGFAFTAIRAPKLDIRTLEEKAEQKARAEKAQKLALAENTPTDKGEALPAEETPSPTVENKEE